MSENLREITTIVRRPPQPDRSHNRLRRVVAYITAPLAAIAVLAACSTESDKQIGANSAKQIAADQSAAESSASAAASESSASASASSAAASVSSAAASISSYEASRSAAATTTTTPATTTATTEASPSRTTSSSTSSSSSSSQAPAPAPQTVFAVNCDADPGYCGPDGTAPVYNAPFLGSYVLENASGERTPLCRGTGNFAGWLMVITGPGAQPNQSGQGRSDSGYMESAVIPGAADTVGDCTRQQDYSGNMS